MIDTPLSDVHDDLLQCSVECSDFWHDNFGGQRAIMATEQGYIICKFCNFHVVSLNSLEVVDVVDDNAAPVEALVSTVSFGIALR